LGSACHKANAYAVTIVNILRIMIRKSAWVFIILMLAVAASPGAAFAIPAGATMMPMNGGSGHHGSQSSGCNCNMPMQTAMARAESSPRTAGGAEPSPCSGTALPITSGTVGTAGRVSGIRRIYAKNVLDHPERAAVYTSIVARPGIDLAGIAAELGMNRETLRYHLDVLESNTRIVVMRDHGIVRYYENHGRYTPLERRVLQHLWNPTAKEILSVVAAKPGITQTELSAHLSVSAPTVRWYVNRFRADGLVTEQREGRYTHYTVVPEVSRYVVPVTAEQAPAVTCA
jgi:predicted transcriptional regulator